MEQRRKRNPGKARTEIANLRIDPQTAFLLELCARSQRRSRANYLEWLITESFKTATIRNESRGRTYTVAELAERLWHPDEAERLKRLFDELPGLLTFEEERLVRKLPEIPDS